MQIEAVSTARVIACLAHGQQRYGEHPYIRHLDDVAALVKGFGVEAEVLAYLHDTLEDTTLRPEQIESVFGAQMAMLVIIVSDPPGRNRKERKASLYSKLGSINTNSSSALALVVKAADRLANVRACISDKNTSLLEMYRKENNEFSIAVQRYGLTGVFLDEICKLLETNGGE